MRLWISVNPSCDLTLFIPAIPISLQGTVVAFLEKRKRLAFQGEVAPEPVSRVTA